MEGPTQLPVVTITRLKAKSGDDGTFGEGHTQGGFKFVTLELPWRNNAHGKSCIPLPSMGRYMVKVMWSNRHKADLPHVLDVPGRDVIEWHPGNLAGDIDLGYASDVEGCQLFGDSIATWREGEVVEGHHLKRDQRGVTNTKATIARILEETGDAFWLEIKEA